MCKTNNYSSGKEHLVNSMAYFKADTFNLIIGVTFCLRTALKSLYKKR